MRILFTIDPTWSDEEMHAFLADLRRRALDQKTELEADLDDPGPILMASAEGADTSTTDT